MLRSFFGSLFHFGSRGGVATAGPGTKEAILQRLIDRAQDLAATRQFDEARRVCGEILALKPDDGKTLMLLAHLQRAEGDLNAAKASVDKVIQLYPGLADAYCLRGDIHRARRSFRSALQDYARAVEADPALIEARMNQGAMHYMLGEFEKALACAQRVLSGDPHNVAAQRNRGLMLRELGLVRDAEIALREAVEQHPDYHEARCSLAMVLVDQGLFEEARQHLNAVLDADLSHNEARWQLSIAHLLSGCFRAGWRTYGSRLHRDDARRTPYSYPQWDGSNLRSGALLVYAEQGLGDDILFASCIPDVLSRAKHCVVECDPRLVELFRRSFPSPTIVGSKHDACPAWQAGGPEISAQIAAGSLPGIFRNEWSDFPGHTGYLVADPVKVGKWRTRLSQLGAGMKIGIAWTGGGIKTRRRLRSLRLLDLLPVLGVPGVQFVSLQYMESAAEIREVRAAHGMQVHHWQEAIDDYDETAALVCALDLVVSVCTAVVHLTGALGRPVCIMAPRSPEWRYLHAGDRLPWYPSARLFRQQHGQDWGPVIAGVRAELIRLRQA